MPLADGWDWPKLLYVATVMLKRSEKEFWRMRPRKLNALSNAHIAMNPQGGSNDKRRNAGGQRYIDQTPI